MTLRVSPASTPGVAFITLAFFALNSWLSQSLDAKVRMPMQKAVADAENIASMNPAWNVMLGHGKSKYSLVGNDSVLIVSKPSIGSLKAGMTAVYRDTTGNLRCHLLKTNTPDGWLVYKAGSSQSRDSHISKSNFVGVIFGIFLYFGDDTVSLENPAIEGYPVVTG